HDLAGEVLVGRALDVHAGVEKREHRGIPGDPDQEVAEVSGPVPVEEVELPEHLPVVAHLVFVHGEVAVPEERHLLFERPARPEHPVGPPVGGAVRLELARPEPVEELVGDGLEPPVAARLDPDAEGLARLLGELGRRGPARRARPARPRPAAGRPAPPTAARARRAPPRHPIRGPWPSPYPPPSAGAHHSSRLPRPAGPRRGPASPPGASRAAPPPAGRRTCP